MPKLTNAEREERIQDLRAKASQLESLTTEPGWELLTEAAEGRKRRDYEQLTKPVEIPVRKFDYDRGFTAGMDYLLGIPGKASETLRLAERSARTMHPEEE
mgnify:FL=1